MTVIVSIQHTGTRFLKRELGSPDCYHVTPQNMRTIRGLTDTFIAVPMRHPARVYESWTRRGRSLDLLTEQYRNLIALNEECTLTFVDVERSPGKPVTIFHTMNVLITPEMEARVPAEVSDFYDNLKLQTAREAARDIR